ncbi:TetR/AcrR family transcriptional regulator [Jeotgalibacillus soli]|uniref:TetR family transcriptional regulator n=1 Tax=Jeotgalibacillus soli TaxID=889306 RepID=A0A0C2W099_9BACL|nr:TetR/AcrR family transcriptional regulator [Jeotgalibacillus soli]KIL50031.1 TetR family transcriptional regulator [Jeotgalibacillus soli]
MSQRGRKKGASGEQSRALLLSIAADEFAQKGYHDTKISTIVKKANLTQPSFYLYFQSKESIFQELVCLFRTKLSELTEQSRLEPGIDLNSLPERITQGLGGIFRFFAENQNLTRIGFFISAEAEEIKKQMAIQIKENLRSEQRDGYFHAHVDMEIFANSLVGIIERLTVTAVFSGLKDPFSIAKEIVHIFLYGLLIDPDR